MSSQSAKIEKNQLKSIYEVVFQRESFDMCFIFQTCNFEIKTKN